jgi:hypothetical protein
MSGMAAFPWTGSGAKPCSFATLQEAGQAPLAETAVALHPATIN